MFDVALLFLRRHIGAASKKLRTRYVKEGGVLSLPSPIHPVWQRIVKGEKSFDFEFLATQIFLGRAQLILFQDNSAETISALADQLRRIFEQNQSHPAVARDVAKLVSRAEGDNHV